MTERHGRAHHVFTDPPYSERVVENARTSRGTKDVSAGWIGAEAPRAFVPFATEAPIIRSLLARANPSRWSVVFADHAHAAALDLEPPRGMRSLRLGAWVKPDGSPQMTGDRPANGFESIAILHSDESGPRWNSGGKRGVWTHLVERDVPWHPTPKPVPLWRELLRDFTDPDDLVFDLYGGSAASGVAGRFEGRRVVLVEIDPTFARLAAQRLREGRGRLVDVSMPAEPKRGTLALPWAVGT
jgi:site-specific DNA-methyltransferase (adenine-specific)